MSRSTQPLTTEEIISKVKLTPPKEVIDILRDELTALFCDILNQTFGDKSNSSDVFKILQKNVSTTDEYHLDYLRLLLKVLKDKLKKMEDKEKQDKQLKEIETKEKEVLEEEVKAKSNNEDEIKKEDAKVKKAKEEELFSDYLFKLDEIFKNLALAAPIENVKKKSTSLRYDNISSSESKNEPDKSSATLDLDIENIFSNYNKILENLEQECITFKGQRIKLYNQLIRLVDELQNEKLEDKIREKYKNKKEADEIIDAINSLKQYNKERLGNLLFAKTINADEMRVLVINLNKLAVISQNFVWEITNVIMDNPIYFGIVHETMSEETKPNTSSVKIQTDTLEEEEEEEEEKDQHVLIQNNLDLPKKNTPTPYELTSLSLNTHFADQIVKKIEAYDLTIDEVKEIKLYFGLDSVQKLPKSTKNITNSLYLLFNSLLKEIENEKTNAQAQKRKINQQLIEHCEEIMELILNRIANSNSNSRRYYDTGNEDDKTHIKKIMATWFAYTTKKTLADYLTARYTSWKYKFNKTSLGNDKDNNQTFSNLQSRERSITSINSKLKALHPYNPDNAQPIPDAIQEITQQLDSINYHAGWFKRSFGGNRNSKLLFHLKEIRKQTTDRLFYLNERYGNFKEEYNQVRQYNNISFEHDLAKRLLDFNRSRKFSNKFWPRFLQNVTNWGLRTFRTYTDPANGDTPNNFLKNNVYFQKAKPYLPDGKLIDLAGKIGSLAQVDDYETVVQELISMLKFTKDGDLDFTLEQNEADHYVKIIERLGELIEVVGSKRRRVEPFYDLLKELQYDIIARVVTGITYTPIDRYLTPAKEYNPKFLVKFTPAQKQRIYKNCYNRRQLEEIAQLAYQEKKTASEDKKTVTDGEKISKTPNTDLLEKQNKITKAYNTFTTLINQKIRNNIPITDEELSNYMFVREQYEIIKNPLTAAIYSRMKTFLSDMHLAARVVRSGVVANSSGSEEAGRLARLKGLAAYIKMIPYAGPALQIASDMVFDHFIGIANAQHSQYIASNADFVDDINEIDQFAVMLASKIASQYLHLFPSQGAELDPGQIGTFVGTVVKRFEVAKTSQGGPLDINDLIERMNLNPVRHGAFLGLFPDKQTIKKIEQKEEDQADQNDPNSKKKKKSKTITITSEDAYNCAGLYTVDQYGNVTFYTNGNPDIELYGFRKVSVGEIDRPVEKGGKRPIFDLENYLYLYKLQNPNYTQTEVDNVRRKIDSMQNDIKKQEKSFYEISIDKEHKLDLNPLIAEMVSRKQEEELCDGLYYVDDKNEITFYNLNPNKEPITTGYRKLSNEEHTYFKAQNEIKINIIDNKDDDAFQTRVRQYENSGLYYVNSEGKITYYTHVTANIALYGFRKMTATEYKTIVENKSTKYTIVGDDSLTKNEEKEQKEKIEKKEKQTIIYWFDEKNVAHFCLPYEADAKAINLKSAEIRPATTMELSQKGLELSQKSQELLLKPIDDPTVQDTLKKKLYDKLGEDRVKIDDQINTTRTKKLDTSDIKEQKVLKDQEDILQQVLDNIDVKRRANFVAEKKQEMLNS